MISVTAFTGHVGVEYFCSDCTVPGSNFGCGNGEVDSWSSLVPLASVDLELRNKPHQFIANSHLRTVYDHICLSFSEIPL